MKKSIKIPFQSTFLKVFPTDKSHEGKPLYRTSRNYYTIENGVAVLIRKIPREERPVRKPTKNTWGGSRGGGRPEKTEEEKKGKNVTFRPSPEVQGILDKQGNGKRTLFIEMAILAYNVARDGDPI